MPITNNDQSPKSASWSELKKKRSFLPLERPLKLFGSTFKVYFSTGITLSPETVLLSGAGLSLVQLMRRDKKRLDRILAALERSARGRHKPSATTRQLVIQLLKPAIPVDVLNTLLDGREPADLAPLQSEWEAFLLGLGEPGEDAIYQVVSRFVQLDHLALSAVQLFKRGLTAEAEALLEPHFGDAQTYWSQSNPNLLLSVAFLLETSLQTLAWLECRQLTAGTSN